MWGIFRLFLAISVVMGHALSIARQGQYPAPYPYLSGEMAVESFFAISGFVITRSVCSNYADGVGGLRRFWQNRFLRLMPPYWVALLAGLALAPASFGMAFPIRAPEGVGWFSNIFIIGQTGLFTDSSVTPTLIASWTLSVELVFYFVISAWAARSREAANIFLLVSLLLDGGTAPWLRHEVFYAGTIWQALPFALGCRLAWAKLPKMQTPVAIAALGILMAYVVAASRFGAAFSGDSSHYFAAVLACAAIIACESVPQGRVGRLMADLSYPVYIIQFPAMALVRFLHGWSFVAAAPFAALVAGIAINRVVEAPIARVRARIRSQATLLDERKVAISLVK